MAVKWLDEPEAHDFDAAAAYLSMVAEADAVTKVVTALKAAPPEDRAAKDILRAAALPMLPSNNVHVRSDLSKISDGKKLSPILLVRGDAARGGAATDRRRLPPRLRRLPHRREHRHPVPARLLAVLSPHVAGFGFGTLALLVVVGLAGPLLAGVPRLRDSGGGRRTGGRNRHRQNRFQSHRSG